MENGRSELLGEVSCIWKVDLKWFVTGDIETRCLSFLVRESKCIPWGGVDGV